MDLDSIVAEAIASIILALAGAVAAWVVARLPGPIRDALGSATHQRDMQLILGAMARRAAAVIGGGVAVSTPVADVVAYTREALPEVVAKLGPSEEALRTIALAALARARAEAAPPPT